MTALLYPLITPYRQLIGLILLLIFQSTLCSGFWTEETPVLEASDEIDIALFGAAVAMDGSIAVVGAYQHPSGGSVRGQAYIFRKVGSNWVEEAILQASDEVNSAWFGTAVAISGTTVLIGAFQHPSGGTSRGQAYIFRYNGSSWVQSQILQASDEFNEAWFGLSLSIQGNLAVIGAPGYSIGANNYGQAYVFRFNGSNWIQEKILKAADEARSSQFGFSVATDGNKIAVGDNNYDTPLPGRGRLFMYSHTGSDWIEEQTLNGSDNPGEFAEFISLDGSRLLIGNPNHSGGGRVYAFEYAAGSWSESQIFGSPDGGVLFGISLSHQGNAAVIGCTGHDSGGGSRGQAYIFRDDGNAWNHEQTLEASDEQDSAQFGYAVSLRTNSAIIGAPSHFSGGIIRGQAYIFNQPTPTPTPAPNRARGWETFE